MVPWSAGFAATWSHTIPLPSWGNFMKRPCRFTSMHRILALVILTGVAVPSRADAAPGWTTAHTVSELVIDDSFTTVIIPPIDNPMSCGVPTYLRVHKDDSNYQSLTAAILSAQAQGRKVRLFAMACHADSSVRITGVWMQP